MSSFICYEYQNKILHVEGKLGEKFRSHHKKKRFYPKHPKNITSNYFIHYQQVLIVPIYLNFCRKTESFVLSLFNHSLLDFICSATWAIVLSSPDCEFFLKKSLFVLLFLCPQNTVKALQNAGTNVRR